jgi:integrase
MTFRQSAARQARSAADAGLLEWEWPVAPASMRVYDKYGDREAVLKLGERQWTIPRQGAYHTVRFAADRAQRDLQQKIVMWTQVTNAPSSIAAFAAGLTAHWKMCMALLVAGPGSIKRQWRANVLELQTATVNKAVLKLACERSVGPWLPKHLALVQGLEAHCYDMHQAQKARIRRREKLIPIDNQAVLTKVLDERVGQPNLKESQAEGLTALALMYQHGVRPVQLLALRVEHVELVRDASGDLVCLVSFHSAKQRKGKEFEIARQLRPEWAPAVAKLHAYALAAGRSRLFRITTVEQVWTRVKRVCLVHAQHKIDFTAGALRHTSAQSLADAGHDRESIRKFLGHTNINAATAYVKASRQQGELINRALGASKLYGRILSLARGDFVSVEQMLHASEAQQIAGVVGDRLVAGIGLCRSGQPHCNYNPVTSCYGCSKFMPSLLREAHEEAVAGMRQQVRLYLDNDMTGTSPASLQLMRALAGAQQALEVLDAIKGESNE